MLTDPAILSSNRKIFNERTNIGEKGILAFYASDIHAKCNKICMKLELDRPDVLSKLEIPV